MKFTRWALLVAALPLAAGCDLGKALNGSKDQVATAAGKELKVDEAATLIAAAPQVPADSGVVRELADRWVDYTLLATAYAEDSTLAVLDLNKLVQPQVEEATINALLAQSIHTDTALTDAQLEEAWKTQGPGQQVHARHVLLRVPDNATPQQRDSVKRQAQSIQQQAAGGADFAALARQYSQDPSKDQGGDLGYFGRGQMVPQFEQAAFALQPGQVSPVVETQFGYHVIKVEDVRQQPLGQNREQFRQFVLQRKQQEGVQHYLDSLRVAANVKVSDDAAKTVKDMAKKPEEKLSGRAAGAALATFNGGKLTAGELQTDLAGAPPEMLQQIVSAPDSQVVGLVKQQATKRVVLAEAARRRVGPSAQEQQALRDQVRTGIRQLLDATGLAARRAPKGAAGNPVIEQQVRDLLQKAVTGQGQMPALGALGQQLRGIYGFEVNHDSFRRVADKVREIRARQPQVPAGQAPGMPGQPGAAPGATPGAAPQGGQPQQPAPAPTTAPAAPAGADTAKK